MKATKISKSQFKAHSLELFRQVESTGKSIIITNHGRPTIEIRKLKPQNDATTLEILRDTVIKFEQPFDPIGENDWDTLK